MLKIVYTTQFKKDYKLAQKRGVDVEELFKVIELLQKQKPLPPEKKDHLAELKEDAEDARLAEKAWKEFEESGEETYTVSEVRRELGL